MKKIVLSFFTLVAVCSCDWKRHAGQNASEPTSSNPEILAIGYSSSAVELQAKHLVAYFYISGQAKVGKDQYRELSIFSALLIPFENKDHNIFSLYNLADSVGHWTCASKKGASSILECDDFSLQVDLSKLETGSSEYRLNPHSGDSLIVQFGKAVKFHFESKYEKDLAAIYKYEVNVKVNIGKVQTSSKETFVISLANKEDIQHYYQTINLRSKKTYASIYLPKVNSNNEPVKFTDFTIPLDVTSRQEFNLPYLNLNSSEYSTMDFAIWPIN